MLAPSQCVRRKKHGSIVCSFRIGCTPPAACKRTPTQLRALNHRCERSLSLSVGRSTTTQLASRALSGRWSQRACPSSFRTRSSRAPASILPAPLKLGGSFAGGSSTGIAVRKPVLCFEPSTLWRWNRVPPFLVSPSFPRLPRGPKSSACHVFPSQVPSLKISS